MVAGLPVAKHERVFDDHIFFWKALVAEPCYWDSKVSALWFPYPETKSSDVTWSISSSVCSRGLPCSCVLTTFCWNLPIAALRGSRPRVCNASVRRCC